MTVALRFGLPGSGDAEIGAFAMTGVAALVGVAGSPSSPEPIRSPTHANSACSH